MPIPTDTLAPILAAVIVGLPAGLLAWTLRRAGAPGGAVGAALLAGLLAGVLAGPAVLGAVRPAAYEQLFVGAAEERAARAETLAGHRRERAALTATGVSDVALRELDEQHRAELAPIIDEADRALAEHRRALASGAAALLALHALLIGPSLAPSRRGAARAAVADAAGAGALFVVVSGIAPLVAALWTGAFTRGEAALMAAACAAPGLGRPLSRWARGVFLAGAGVWLALLAAAAAIGGCGGAGWSSAGWIAAATLALVAGIAVVRPARAAIRRRWSRIGRRAATGATLPAAVAWLVAQADPASLGGSAAFWVPALVGVLIVPDARWAGAWAAHRLFGPREAAGAWRAGARLADGGGAACMSLAAVAVVAAGCVGDRAGSTLGVSVVLAATALAVTRRPRLAVARSLDGDD